MRKLDRSNKPPKSSLRAKDIRNLLGQGRGGNLASKIELVRG
jgi:hypothetical protein